MVFDSHRAFSIVVSCCVFATAVIACEKVVDETPWINNIEMQPCGGNCSSYDSCPRGTECGFAINGVKNCVDGTRTVYSIRMTGGSNQGGACCQGGAPRGFTPGGQTCTQPYASIPYPAQICRFFGIF